MVNFADYGVPQRRLRFILGELFQQHIAGPVLDQAADGFRRVEFRIMHRQRHQMPPHRQGAQFRPGMKGRLIPDHDVFSLWITRRQMAQKQTAHFQAGFQQAQNLGAGQFDQTKQRNTKEKPGQSVRR
ncbi:MAG TPA: hypothetical protein VFY06_10130 [Verrucomicrobiae bacterium]|nr:hypothetical protein [Verrucomicrobiae bacterium]